MNALFCTLMLTVNQATPPTMENVPLGTVAVGKEQGRVLFSAPADDGKSFRVDVVIARPANSPLLRGDRFEVWLLAKGGKAVALRERPREVLVESVLGKGASADAAFFFDASVPVTDLVAAIVRVDDQVAAFEVQRRIGPRSSDKP
jgi:hypothetical protein